MKTERSGQSKN